MVRAPNLCVLDGAPFESSPFKAIWHKTCLMDCIYTIYQFGPIIA